MNKRKRILAVSFAKVYNENPLNEKSTAILVVEPNDLKDATIFLFFFLFRTRCVMPNKIKTNVKKNVQRLSKIIDKCRYILEKVTSVTKPVITGETGGFSSFLGTFSVTFLRLNQ